MHQKAWRTNARTHERTNEWTNEQTSQKQYAPNFSQNWGHNNNLLHRLSSVMWPASVAQLDAPPDWRLGGRGFNPRRGRQHSFVEIDHEIFSTAILSLPLIHFLIVLGFNDTSTLVGHFVSSPREREKIEEIVETMKERDRGERGKWMKVKTHKKLNIPPLPIPAARTAGLAQL